VIVGSLTLDQVLQPDIIISHCSLVHENPIRMPGFVLTLSVACLLQEGMGYDFLVATTKVITGNTLLRPIIASSKEGMV
jgi:hypothetical protein